MESIRILGPGDEALLEDFCARHPDTTLFFRSNALAAGLEDGGDRLQGTYAAAFAGGAIQGVAGHFWNENLLLEAPVALEALVRAAVRASGRGVRGFVGPYEQALAARASLGLAGAPAIMESREILFSLELEALCVPAALSDGRLSCRRAGEGDWPLIEAWRIAYAVEALGEADTPVMRARVADGLRARHAKRHLWLLEDASREGDARVSTTGFNAVTPEAVQVGGVWTPPELRSRGYARAVVAGSLRDARDGGAQRSILFTQEENLAAQACYRGLGYEEVGTYGLVLLQTAHRPNT